MNARPPAAGRGDTLRIILSGRFSRTGCTRADARSAEHRAAFRGRETLRGSSDSQTELNTGDRPVDLDEVRRAKCGRQASSPVDASEPAAPACDAVGPVILK